jgi:hypothetical protein
MGGSDGMERPLGTALAHPGVDGRTEQRHHS